MEHLKTSYSITTYDLRFTREEIDALRQAVGRTSANEMRTTSIIAKRLYDGLVSLASK